MKLNSHTFQLYICCVQQHSLVSHVEINIHAEYENWLWLCFSTFDMCETWRREALSHPRSQVEPAGHAVGHRGVRGCNFSPWPVLLTWQEEKLSDMEENRVDLHQQRHHSQTEIETRLYGQTETGDHLRKEFKWKMENNYVLYNFELLYLYFTWVVTWVVFLLLYTSILYI